MTELLTDHELKVMDLTTEIFNTMVQHVIARGPTHRGDVEELAFRIHAIQHMVMAQAAARAYPRRFRLLGGVPESAPKAERQPQPSIVHSFDCSHDPCLCNGEADK